MKRLPYAIISFICFIIFCITPEISRTNFDLAQFLYISFSIIFTFATISRLHNRGKSGWNFLWMLIPIVFPVYTTYNCIKK